MGKKRFLLCLLAACVLGSGALGCKGLKNTEIVVTTGLSSNEVFKIGASVCTLPEAMVYLTNTQNQYESVYGVEMWDHDFGGISLEEYVKNSVVSRLATVKSMVLLAKEQGVALTEEEKTLAAEAAKTYYQSLNAEEIAYMDVTEKLLKTMYEEYALSNKTYTELTRDVNTEISDDEARVITLQQIFMPLYETGENGELKQVSAEKKAELDYQMAEAYAKAVEPGADFSALANTYNQASSDTLTIGRGEMEPGFDETAFELETGEISPVFETEKGCYILKCINHFDREATEKNKQVMAEKRKDEAFNKSYDTLIANTPSQFHTRLWEKIHFEANDSITTQSFFEVYDQTFGSF